MVRSPEAPRFKRILKKAERIGAAGLVATSLTTGIDAAISSVPAKAPEAAVASPSRSFKLEIPQDVLKSVQTELATKDKKPKGDKGKNQEAQGSTPTTIKEQEVEMEKDIKAVSKSVEATLNMTPEEFTAWTRRIEQDGKDNQLNYVNLPDGTQWKWDFPIVQGGGRLIIPSNDGLSIQGYPNKYPMVEHMGLVSYLPEKGLWVSLAFLNGSVTIPLLNETGGSATVTFATSIWPDGRKIPYAWISNFNLPNNPALGPNNSSLTDIPEPNYTTSRNHVDTTTVKSKQVSREDFLAQLDANIGKPIEFIPLTNSLLKESARYSPSGEVVGYDVDASISVAETNQFAPIFDALQAAYFAQDGVALDEAQNMGLEAGIFLPNNISSRKELRDIITKKLEKMTDLDSALANLPFGTVTFLPGSTTPDALNPSATSAVKTRAKK